MLRICCLCFSASGQPHGGLPSSAKQSQHQEVRLEEAICGSQQPQGAILQLRGRSAEYLRPCPGARHRVSNIIIISPPTHPNPHPAQWKQYLVVSSRKVLFYISEANRQNISDPVVVLDIVSGHVSYPYLCTAVSSMYWSAVARCYSTTPRRTGKISLTLSWC